MGEPAWMLPADLPDAGGMSREYGALVGRLRTMVRLGMMAPEPGEVGTRYSLTESGQKAYRTFPAGRWDPTRPVGAFCYGTAEVAGVVRWTEAAEGLGQVTTKVTYLRRLREAASWAEDAELRRQFPYVERELATRTAPAEDSLTLVLASDGWRALGR